MKAKEVINRLEKVGFIVNRVTGSHYIMYNPITRKTVVVPFHGGRDIKRPILIDIAFEAGIKRDDFFSS